MKRTMTAFLLAAAVGGCMSADHSADVSSKPTVRAYGESGPPCVPGVAGPWGEPYQMAAPYTATSAHINPWQAQRLMSQSVPLDMVPMNPNIQQASAQMPGMGMPPGGMPMMPPGMPFSPSMMPPGGGRPNGPVVPASAMSCAACPPGGNGVVVGRTQIRFTGPDGMRIAWFSQTPDGRPGYSAPMVEAPGRYNFMQASIYRLKLSNIRGRPGLEVYPTLEVVPANPKTAAFLAHSAVPLEFTAQDFQEITEGKYLVKVIYLPDPQFQELAATGTDEIISTRLEPGADPILEAQRRGCILMVIRMGNLDQEAPNTPPMEATGPGAGPVGMMPPPMMPAQALTGPGQSMPSNLGNALPPSLPNPVGTTSKAAQFSGIRPVSATQMLPDPKTIPSTTPMPPAPLTSTSASVPPPPPMPPSPAELATQGAKQ
jgi:hypothetical protein